MKKPSVTTVGNLDWAFKAVWDVAVAARVVDCRDRPTHRHVHAGWKVPPPFEIKDLDRLLNNFWLRFAFHGSYDVQEYRFRSGSEQGRAAYATKFLTETENIIESTKFLRS